LSGFFSKDAILARAWEHQAYLLFCLGVFVAALTTLYMFRLVFVAFTGPAKSQAPDHAHESPAVMTVPLLALAVPSALAGFWGLDLGLARQYGAAMPPAGAWLHHVIEPFAQAPVAAWAGLFAAVAGFALSWRLYRGAVSDPLPGRLGAVARWMRERFYFDELYARLIALTQDAAARLAEVVDRWVLAGAVVKGTHGTVELLGRLLRLMQTGSLQVYAVFFVVGVVVVLYFMNQR
jgi:NADH-quinone oxidoreductase subunit L